ncbi:MAG: class I SAM-dependent methyltransferase [bacterium]
MHAQSYNRLAEFAKKVPKHAVVLDVGAYDVNGNLRGLFGPKYIGFDIEKGPNVDIVEKEPFKIPLADASVDAVVSANSLEHVSMPWKLVLEMDRVLRPSGLLCISAAWAWGYHAYPTDCWRFSHDAYKVLFGEWMIENGRKSYVIVDNRIEGLDSFFEAIKP